MPSTPNVVWIVMEDVSPRLGCYGDDLARTPHLDALADGGRVYENAFCTTGVCAPSRAALVTGLYPPALGAHHMQPDVTGEADIDPYEAVPPHYVTAVSEHLRQGGYYCTLDLKTHYQFGEPFTMWDHHGEGAGWWDDRRDPGQPFFSVFTNNVTHESGMWDPAAIDREPWGGTVETPTTAPEDVDVPPYLVDSGATRRTIARQYDNLERADAWVGHLLDRLAADGHAADTLVVVTADHGEGLPRNKRWPYDSGTHVPLIVRWPGTVEGNDTSERLVSLVDLAPTTLSAAGIDIPNYVHGRPFLGPEASEREYVFSTRDREGHQLYDMVRSVRDDRYRYVRHYYPDQPYVGWIPYRNRHPAMKELLEAHAEGRLDDVQRRWVAGGRPAEALYDLRADPHEVENLAGDPDHRDVRDRLRDALDDWRARTGDRDQGAESETEYRNRVWPTGEQPVTATPTFVPNAPGNRGREAANDGGTIGGPATIAIYSPTQGASVGYTTESGDDLHWRLYDGPIHLESGDRVQLRAKAIRYGYAESDERAATFEVE